MFNKLKQNQFLRNVITVLSGSAGAQALTMLFTPVVTRLYGAEAFGAFGVFLAILAIISPIAALAYPISIVLPQRESEAQALVKLSFCCALFVFIFFLIIFILFHYEIAFVFEFELTSNLLILIPLTILFVGTQQIIQQWLIRNRGFSILANATILHSFILNVTKVGVGMFLPMGVVLVLLTSFGHFLFALLLFIGVSQRQSNIPSILFGGRKEDIKSIAKNYIDFPMFRAPQQLVNALSNSLPILMIASYFGPVSAGLFTLAKSIMSVPASLIGKSIGDVFYPKVTEIAHRKGNVFGVVLKVTFVLAVIGIVPFMLIILFGPMLFSFIFGGEWQDAGEYARWLSVGLYFAFINVPSVKVIPILGIQALFMYFTIFSLVIRFTSLIVGYLFFNSDVIAIALFGLVDALINIFIITFVLLKCRSYNL